MDRTLFSVDFTGWDIAMGAIFIATAVTGMSLAWDALKRRFRIVRLHAQAQAEERNGRRPDIFRP